MPTDAGPAIEVQARLAPPERWPVKVPPARDELLSSWLHRLALAHGVSPRGFGEILGLGYGAWSARLDLALPRTTLELLHYQTGMSRDEIVLMTIAAREWKPLLLPLRHSLGAVPTEPMRATWLQFCPACLVEDQAPLFSTELAARHCPDLSATRAILARPLSRMPPRSGAFRPTRTHSTIPMRPLRLRSPPGLYLKAIV